jgi:hypothetical protein
MTTTTTRRAILAGAAALPALAVPAIASEADPTFAALAHYEAVDRRTNAFLELEPGSDEPGHAAWEAQRRVDMDEWNAARDAILNATPTTAAGAVAAIRFVLDDPAYGTEDGEDMASLLRSLERAITRLVRS